MHRTYEKDGETFSFREWLPADDPMLRDMMQAHVALDPGWPPAYARDEDLAEWLGQAADQGRWVALDSGKRIVGHGGLGSVKAAPYRKVLMGALDCAAADLVEICRIVVHPEMRSYGLAGELTRVALRAAIESGRFPVSNVLSNRGGWLDMMLATGWREVGRMRSSVSDSEIVSMLPPERFVTAVRGHRGKLK